MSEQRPQNQALEFARIVPAEAVNTAETVDAFRATVLLPEESDGTITVTLGNMLRLPVAVDAIAYPFTGNPRTIAGGLAEQIAESAGLQVFDEVEAKQRHQSPTVTRSTGSAFTSSSSNMHRDGVRANRLMHVVFDPQTEAESEDAIERAVTGALTTASSEGIQSIALPLFGTSPLNGFPVAPGESLKRIVRATESFMQSNPDTPTKDVRVVAFYQPRENVLNGVQKNLAEI